MVTNRGCIAMSYEIKSINHPKWKAFCYDCEDKIKIDTEAVGDTKKRILEVFPRLEKNAGISVLHLVGVLL